MLDELCSGVSLSLNLQPPPPLSMQEIRQLRQEIDAQSEIISIMGDALKENEKRHESCPSLEKQP